MNIAIGMVSALVWFGRAGALFMQRREPGSARLIIVMTVVMTAGLPYW